jgi:divalent metal cation (Fe/Co/Zn/Cd) transporter
VVAQDTHVHDAHSLIDHIEEDITSKLPHSSVTVHIEPCDGSCPQCAYPCPQEKRGS